MKREITTRRLHMGCGECLIGRTPARSRQSVPSQGRHAIGRDNAKTGKGRR